MSHYATEEQEQSLRDWDEGLLAQHRLGVHSKKTKVNMGPVKRVPSLELYIHGILIRFGNDVTGLISIHSLRDINHMRKPFDVLFRIWTELLDKLRCDGHFIFKHI